MRILYTQKVDFIEEQIGEHLEFLEDYVGHQFRLKDYPNVDAFMAIDPFSPMQYFNTSLTYFRDPPPRIAVFTDASQHNFIDRKGWRPCRCQIHWTSIAVTFDRSVAESMSTGRLSVWTEGNTRFDKVIDALKFKIENPVYDRRSQRRLFI